MRWNNQKLVHSNIATVSSTVDYETTDCAEGLGVELIVLVTRGCKMYKEIPQ